MKIGICLNEYAREFPLKEAARLLREDGFEAIDFSNLADVEGQLYTEDEEKVKLQLAEIAKALAAEGIVISQIHGPWRYPPKDDTAEERANWLALMKRSVRAATYIGAPYVVVHPLMPFGANSPENPAEVLRINTEHYTSLCDYAKDFGITVCIENMPFPDFPMARVSDLICFVDSLGKDNFKICLDTGHANVCGENIADAIRALGSRLATFHIHDNDGKQDQHHCPGFGNADFSGMGGALAEIGFSGVLSAEAHVARDSTKDSFRSAAKSLANSLLKIKENRYF